MLVLIPAHDEEASIGNVLNILGKLSVTSHDRAAAAAHRLRLFASFPAGTLPGPLATLFQRSRSVLYQEASQDH